MAALRLSLFILASLAAINADTCNKEDAYPRLLTHFNIGSYMRSLPKGNAIQGGLELVRDFFKTSPFPTVGYLDPLDIEAYRIEVDDDDMIVDLSETTIKGLLGFEITDIKTSLNLEKIQLDLLFPEISVSGKYDMPPISLLPEADMYGNGEFVLTARNLRIQITANMAKTIAGDMFCENMESELCLEAGDAKVTGLNDDELDSEAFSLRLSENLPGMVKDMKRALDVFLETYTEIVNTKLAMMQFFKNRV